MYVSLKELIIRIIRLGGRLRSALKSIGVLVTSSALAMGAVTQSSKGVYVENLTPEIDAKLKQDGAAFAGRVVWVEGTLNTGEKYDTHGILTSPDKVMLDAHTIPSTTSIATIDWVGNGTNAFDINKRGTVVKAASWARHPDYVQGNKFTPDVGHITLQTPLPFTTGPTQFGIEPVVGETYTVVSFGPVLTADSSFADGVIRAWNMVNLGNQTGSASPDLYFRLQGEMYGVDGDSSAVVFNNLGQFVGLLKDGAQFTPANGILKFTQSDLVEYSYSINQTPEPVRLIYSALVGLWLLGRNKRKSV